MGYKLLIVCCVVYTVTGLQSAPQNVESAKRKEIKRPHIAILKQINTLNEDGSYTYGYHNADGSFKIETRYKDGGVKGKYGFIDADGNVKEYNYEVVAPPPTEKPLLDYDYDLAATSAPARRRHPIIKQKKRV